MKNIYPKFYKDFKCIAHLCPDSCCKDWDVVVDDNAHKFYESVHTQFGEKIKSVTATDDDGDRIFVLHNGKCPFWNDQKLCDIYINLGEEHLCKTCQRFPRLTLEYENFTEHMLSFACPEAARIMLEGGAFEMSDTVNNDDCNNALMKFLIQTREGIVKILKNGKLAFSRRIIQALLYGERVQNLLDNDDFDFTKCQYNKKISLSNNEKADITPVVELHKNLDTMSDEWKNILEKICVSKPTDNNNFDGGFTAMALYYVYRYYFTAVDSYNILCTLKRIASAYITIGAAINFEQCNLVRIMQLYSKEVEHSYENYETMEEEFFTNPDFSVENFIKMIK